MKTVRLLDYLFATVWIANGLFCKVLDLVPRHREIVGRIFGDDHAALITRIIGLSEILMAVWVLSRRARRLNAVTQMVVIATMNIVEFVLVPDLLLWGRANAFFALLFVSLIYYKEFHLEKAQTY